MSQESNRPPTFSHNALLKLLAATPPGTSITIQPEHIAAVQAALGAMEFQRQVRALAAQNLAPEQTRPHSSGQSTPSSPKQTGGALAPNRPSAGSGALWTPEEEQRLSAQWARGDALGAIAESHKRSAAACFMRLARLKTIEPDANHEAGEFLAKNQSLVNKANQSQWPERARALGWQPLPAERQTRRSSP
jgi:hypothetical protein